jgi:hypothetical protein
MLLMQAAYQTLAYYARGRDAGVLLSNWQPLQRIRRQTATSWQRVSYQQHCASGRHHSSCSYWQHLTVTVQTQWHISHWHCQVGSAGASGKGSVPLDHSPGPGQTSTAEFRTAGCRLVHTLLC